MKTNFVLLRGLTTVCLPVLLGIVVKITCSRECQTVTAVHGYRLVNHVLKTVRDTTLERCEVLCTEHPDCYSINHFTTTSTCELNNKTRFWFLRDFLPYDNVFYMDILVRQYDICVYDNPCPNSARCIPYPNNGTFHCQCRKHYTGKNCEELQVGGNLTCSSQVLEICQTNMTAWQATILGPTSVNLLGCNPHDVANIAELLLFVSRARLDYQGDYGQYQIVRVKENTGCTVTLLTPINITLSGTPCELIAQRLPYFDHISLTQSCQVTCRARSGAVGGILALRATKLMIDSTSKIQVNGKGFHGGVGGNSSGGGGLGGQTFVCLSSSYGKGGDRGQRGDHGGGSGEVPTTGPGGLNAGGGGGDSTLNSDDGAGGGGGGGHFSGGGGGGGGASWGGSGGTGGIASTIIHAYAGGGGSSSTPGQNGGNGGSTGGNAGNSVRGGIGGSSPNAGHGGGGGGGGFQYGNIDFNTHLSYGGGGGGGGGSQFGCVGGKGGNGGGLVLLLLDQLTLNGMIEAQGSRGECASPDVPHLAAPGGSGAGGSVVIFTKELFGNVAGKILVQGGTPIQCANGTGGGGGGGIGRWVVKTLSTLYKSG